MTFLGEIIVNLGALGSKSDLVEIFPIQLSGTKSWKNSTFLEVACVQKVMAHRAMHFMMQAGKLQNFDKIQITRQVSQNVIHELLMKTQFTVPACILADGTLFLNATTTMLHPPAQKEIPGLGCMSPGISCRRTESSVFCCQ